MYLCQRRATVSEMPPLAAPVETGAAGPAAKAPRANRLWIGAFVLFVAAVAAISLFKASHRPFWYDEICTVIVVRQHGFIAQWRALMDGIDMNPIGFHILETPFARAIPKPELAYRLAPLLGCLLMQVSLFLLVRPIAGCAGAFAAALLPSLTTAMLYFTEARPYGLVLGFTALGIFCWQRASRAGYAVAVWACLAAALCCHYYALFGIVSLAAAEVLAWAITRRFRFPIWAAIAASVLPLLAFAPLMHRIHEIYGSHFWAKPTKSFVVTAYGPLLGLGKGLGLALAVLLTVALVMLLARARTSGNIGQVHACCAALAFLLLPTFAVVLANAGRGGLTERYMLPTILGFAIGSGVLLGCAGSRIALAVLAVAALLALARHAAGPKPEFDMRAADEHAVVAFLQSKPAARVLVSDGLEFLPMAYYAPPSVAGRICALDAPKAALQHIGTDSIEIALELVRKYQPLTLVAPGQLARSTAPLYVFSDRRTVFDWPPDYFVREGYRLEAREFVGKSTFYSLTSPAR